MAGYAIWGGGTGVGTFDAPGVKALVRLDGTHELLGQPGLVDPVVFGYQTRLGAPFIINAGGRLFPSTQAVIQETPTPSGALWWIWDNQCAHWNPGDTVTVRIETLDRGDTRLEPPDTTLNTLAIDGATLNEAFDPATADYTADAAADTETVTIEATPTDAGACTVDITPADADSETDGHQINLAAPTEDETSATTDVTVTVTAPGGATRSYQIAINRPAPLSDDATLSTLAITDDDDAVVLLTPAFDTDTPTYTAQAAADTDHITITATPADGDATLQIAPADADAETDGHQIDVAEGTPTAITVTVTAADGTTTQAYEVAVSRDAQTRAAAASAGLDIAPGWSFDPATKRYHITPRRGATSGRLTMTPVSGSDLEAFTVNASLRTRRIGPGGITRLSATKDTILFIRASGGHRETLYTVRLRPPAAANQRTADQRTATNNKGGGWTTTITTRNNPTLSALAVSPGTLDPAFAAATHTYTVDVAHNVEHLTVAPTAAGTATYTITPTDADTNTAGHQIALTAATGTDPAETTIAIALTDGTNMASYTITAKRAAPPPVAPITFELPEHCTLHELEEGNWTQWRKYDDNYGTDDGFCAQTHGGRPTRSAEYYQLLIRQTGQVTIRTDNYPAAVLVVISADGEIIASDKRGYKTNQNYKPSLTLTLDRGAYVIEVGNRLYKGPNHDDGHRLGYWGDHIIDIWNYRLDGLTISGVDMTGFDPQVGEYRRRIAADVSTVTIAPSAPATDAVIKITPQDADTNTEGHQVNLDADGETEITVTAAHREVQHPQFEYRVVVTQLPDTTSPLSTDTKLSALSLGDIDIGTFDSSDPHYTYKAGFHMSVDGVTATVAATTTHAGADWTASPPDADSNTEGHQILINGDVTVTVTVTAQDGLHRQTYTITPVSAIKTLSAQGCALCQAGSIDKDEPDLQRLDQLLGGTSRQLRSLWFNDNKFMTMYARKFMVFDADSGDTVEQFTITSPAGVSYNSYGVRSFWTDGETLWVLFDRYVGDVRIHAYSMETKQLLTNRSISIGTHNGNQQAIWSDGTTMYVLIDSIHIRSAAWKPSLLSYDLATGRHVKTVRLSPRVPSEGRGSPYEALSMWSDGKTLWVSHWKYLIRAHDLHTGARVAALDIDHRALSGRTFGGGLWSDGHTMWSLDVKHDRLFPYAIPESARLKSLTVSDGDIGVFSNGIFDYAATVPAGTTTTTVTAEQAFTGGSASVTYSPTDADTGTDGHQVTLTAGQDNVVTITVTAPNGTDTETYTLTITHTT